MNLQKEDVDLPFLGSRLSLDVLLLLCHYLLPLPELLGLQDKDNYTSGEVAS
ncbi:MAG: hypothetical protein PHU06_07185 [Gallionella sp.]|jgi:hypothetical protein|nr:hypothetical protein [Gallionella sp.]